MDATDYVSITLPYPPSANRYWRSYRGRVVKSAEAKAYQQEAGWIAKLSGFDCTTRNVSITLRVYRPRKTGDLDNSLKILIDSMKGIIYEDDEQVVVIHAERYEDKNNPRVDLLVEFVTE
jgi:crossover junction endodeoxyribonuclease RusA